MQTVVAAVEDAEVLVGHEQVGVARPPDRLHVAQPAVAVLEIGLQQVGDVAGLLAPLDDARPQRVEPAPAVLAPAHPALGDQPAGELVVAGQGTGAEQRRRRLEVVGGEGEVVVDGPHGVAELEAGVPERIPQRRRQLLDARRPLLVHQDHVDVAERRQLPAPVAADGEQRHRPLAPPPLGLGAGLVEQARQELVHVRGQRLAQRTTAQRAIGDQLVATSGQPGGHRRRVGRRRRARAGERTVRADHGRPGGAGGAG